MAMSPKKLHIKTFGCQMNAYDSERMAEALAPAGFELTEAMGEADLVILNTCHIREKAAEKVYSELGRVRLSKEARKAEGRDTMVAVAGCVAGAAVTAASFRCCCAGCSAGGNGRRLLTILLLYVGWHIEAATAAVDNWGRCEVGLKTNY